YFNHLHHRSLFDAPALTVLFILSLHDALPIFSQASPIRSPTFSVPCSRVRPASRSASSASVPSSRPSSAASRVSSRISSPARSIDRKSTRLNSSHVKTSYAVFCLKKKNQKLA